MVVVTGQTPGRLLLYSGGVLHVAQKRTAAMRPHSMSVDKSASHRTIRLAVT